MAEVETPGATISSLISGQGPDQVICLHGLGSNKTSFFETIAALTPDHTVHAIDLPGFGSSSKPARGAYNAPYFARSVLGYMDAMSIERAHLVGNSMGGRIAIELALTEPDRAETLSLLAPVLAFRRRRELVPLVKLIRPELAAIPHPLRHRPGSRAVLEPVRATGAARPRRRRHRRGRVLPHLPVSLGADRLLRRRPQHLPGRAGRRARALDPAARLAHARPVHLGRSRPPRPGRLLPARGRGASAAPARSVLTECGHVPQVELPERANGLIREQVESCRARRQRPPRARSLLRRAVDQRAGGAGGACALSA